MTTLYQSYLALGEAERKLLSLAAFIGKRIDEHIIAVYLKQERLSRDDFRKLMRKLSGHFQEYNPYYNEYTLNTDEVAPLLLYQLEQMPLWVSLFRKLFRHNQSQPIGELLTKMGLCIEGHITSKDVVFNEKQTPYLVPLSSDTRFLSLLLGIPADNLFNFISSAVVYQLLHDQPDPAQILSRLAEKAASTIQTTTANTIHSLIALYDYYSHGRFDATATIHNNIYAKMLTAVRSLYMGDYDKAVAQYALALRISNHNSRPYEKGLFHIALNNYLLTMAYHLKTSDEGKKLAALLKKEPFRSSPTNEVAFWIASYLNSGEPPTKRVVQNALKPSPSRPPFYQYMVLLAARFFHIDVEQPPQLPVEPETALLRHELSAWSDSPIPLTNANGQPLAECFGGGPLLKRIPFKQQWEMLLDELTPKDGSDNAQLQQAQTVRVSYVIRYNRVEVREQTRLKSGEWGAGKQMSIDTFRRGTTFMDDADRAIASSITGYYSYDIEVATILPHLIGSDRVYFGHYAPFEPVTIDEEKPYLIIEHTQKGFTVKSNLGDSRLERDKVIYRKDSDTHYTVIKLTNLQRSYYSRLLAVGTFPLEAENQLREFLPKVSNIIEVHSPLVEGGSTLDRRDGQPQLCLQALPTAGSRNLFNLYCLALPLPDGRTFFEPAKGLNPCVAEAQGVRYQVTRDIKGERANLQLITTFIEDHDLATDALATPFADRTPVQLTVEGLLNVMEFVRQQPESFFMEWPEGGQLHLKSSQTSRWDIHLKSKNGWFEVEGEIPIDDDTVITASQLLQLVAESPKGGFVRLSDNEFITITDKLRRQLARLESLSISDHGHMHISELHASLLGSALNGEINIGHDERIDQLQKKIKKSMNLTPAISTKLKAELRDYQADGYQWMVRMTDWGAGVCLADDMGLGKTVETIAFLLHTASKGPALVAAPASVVLNWLRELERFAPSLNAIVLNSATDRHATITKAAKGDVVLTTYGLFVTEGDDLTKKKWATVCLDEAHVIKNRETKTSASVMQLQANYRLMLTGTPVQNHLGELWNLYQFLNPGLLGSYDQFQRKYIVPIEQQGDKERSRQLKRIVQPFILRRTKQEVIEELPDKTEVNMPVELTEEEMAIYEVIRRRAKEMLENETASSSSLSVNTLAEITRLRQAACSAQLVDKGWQGDSSKVKLLLQLVADIVGGGNSVLVFSQFTSFLALVKKALDQAGQAYIYLDGSVPMKKRQQLVAEFQRGEHNVFLISLKAGGLGMNLTGANYVIHLDPWWNPAIEQQATDRTYRIGQRQNVTVYHLIAQHTIEEKILRLHETKRNLADQMLEGTSQSHKLTSQQLLEMIGQQ